MAFNTSHRSSLLTQWINAKYKSDAKRGLRAERERQIEIERGKRRRRAAGGERGQGRRGGVQWSGSGKEGDGKK
jgi:hypothetical protein